MLAYFILAGESVFKNIHRISPHCWEILQELLSISGNMWKSEAFAEVIFMQKIFFVFCANFLWFWKQQPCIL